VLNNKEISTVSVCDARGRGTKMHVSLVSLRPESAAVVSANSVQPRTGNDEGSEAYQLIALPETLLILVAADWPLLYP
jgi:hypothetical protein